MKVKKSDAELYNAERDAYVTKLEASLLTLTAERDAEVRRARTAEAECERLREENAALLTRGDRALRSEGARHFQIIKAKGLLRDALAALAAGEE